MSEIKRETLRNWKLLNDLIGVIYKRTNDYLKERFPEGKPTWWSFFWRGSGTTGFRRAKKILKICEFFKTGQGSKYFQSVFIYSLCTYKDCESGLIIGYIGRSIALKLNHLLILDSSFFLIGVDAQYVFNEICESLKTESKKISYYVQKKYPDKFPDLERHAKNFQDLLNDKNISLENKPFSELSQIIYSTGNRQEFKMTVLEKEKEKHRNVP